MTPDMDPADHGRRTLLVASDLMARARVVDAARAAGVDVRAVSPAAAEAALEEGPYELVILDLDAGREALLDVAGRARGGPAPPRRVVAFVSHVDESLMAAARARGVDPVPRGRFWRELPGLFAPHG